MPEVEADPEAMLDPLAEDVGEPDALAGSDEVEAEAEVVDEVVLDSMLVATSVDVSVTAELLDNQSGLDPLRPKYTDHASRPPPVRKPLAK